MQFAATSGLLSDKADLVGLTFSEYIDTQSADAGVAMRKKGETKALALTSIAGTGAHGPSIGFTLAGGFDEQAEYVIELAQTITTKAGVMIDTNYDGTPGGGQMVITLRPASVLPQGTLAHALLRRPVGLRRVQRRVALHRVALACVGSQVRRAPVRLARIWGSVEGGRRRAAAGVDDQSGFGRAMRGRGGAHARSR